MPDGPPRRPLWAQVAYSTANALSQLAPFAIVAWGLVSAGALLATPIAGPPSAVLSLSAAVGVAYFYGLWAVAERVRVRTQPASVIPTADLREIEDDA